MRFYLPDREEGFTLVEMMIAMVLALVGLGILGQAFLAQQVSYDEQSEVVDMQANAKIAMQMMTNELLMAGFIPTGTNMPSADVSSQGWTGNGAEDIEEAAENSITVLGDIDDDGSIETIRYAWGGTISYPLTRESWDWSGSAWGSSSSSGGDELADNIQSLTFEYYNASDTELTAKPLVNSDRSNVRKIKINLTVQPKNPNPNFSKTRDLTTNIKPRNLGL